MYTSRSIFYYLTVMNEQYAMPEAPPNSREGILKGMYRFKAAADSKAKLKAQLFGSGAILNEVVKAQEILQKYGVAADVWSVTSYTELYRDGHACERWNMLHPTETESPLRHAVPQGLEGVFVAASDNCKVLADSIDRWMPRRIRALGTDGSAERRPRRAARVLRSRRAVRRRRDLSELLKEGQITPGSWPGIQGPRAQPEKPNPRSQ